MSHDDYMPKYPPTMPLWQRVLCVLGYHKREARYTESSHKFPGMRLRDRCARCNALLD